MDKLYTSFALYHMGCVGHRKGVFIQSEDKWLFYKFISYWNSSKKWERHQFIKNVSSSTSHKQTMGYYPNYLAHSFMNRFGDNLQECLRHKVL